MGLAASQARFLAITSRKAYCEFESMQIAQDKLSVTRELANATTKYQNSLDATKLVWQYDDDYVYDLSYGLLMTPSVVNDYNPYLITDRTGAVVLNSKYAAAAEAAGIPQTGTDRTEDGFSTFMDALVAQGLLSDTTAETIKGLDYNVDAGYGATPLSKNEAELSNVLGLAYQLQDITLDSLFNDLIASVEESYNNSSGNTYSGLYVYSNGTEVDDLSSISLSDVLTGNVVVVYQGESSENMDAVIETFTENLEKMLSTLCGVDGELYNLLGVDYFSQEALTDALALTIENYLGNIDLTEKSDHKTDSKTVNQTKTKATNDTINGIYAVQSKSSSYKSCVAVNLSTLMAYFLTQFELCLNGYGNGYILKNQTGASSYVTDDLYYTFIMKDKNSVDDKSLMLADYYQQLYNNICINGWTQNDQIDDATYLENALKNGTYFITSLSDDGYFYQNRYNAMEYLVEVTDEDAIARAEAEYTSMKVQLDYKEEKLDLEMTNLDTEISSLTTEYDTVKNLISNNVQKVFTMFQ